MIKIQMFSNVNAAVLQANVNEFIRGKKVIDIKYTAFSITQEYRNGLPYRNDIVDRVLVIYEEEDK